MRCPACNAENAPDAGRCALCGGALAPPRRKPARRRGPAAETDSPFAPRGGPDRAALRAYRVCLLGLIPGLGLLLGPAAVVLGALARRRGRSAPDFTGQGRATAAVALGAAIALTNWLGAALMVLALR